MKSLDQCRLYAFVDLAYLRGRPPVDIAKALCEGGADLIQLRAKQQPPSVIQSIAEELDPITNAARVRLIINDYPEIALRLRRPFCHLGQEDFFGRGRTHAGPIVPPGPPVKLGLSTHTPAQARRAVEAGADYIAVGPVFATATKPDANPVTLDYVRWAARHIRIPWFAIGGIHLTNLPRVIEAGATRVCIVSAILEARDLAKACHQIRQRLPS